MRSSSYIGVFAAFCLSLTPMPAYPAAAGSVVSNTTQRPLPDVLEQVTPAVVNIAVTSGSSAETNPLYNDPFFRRYFNMPEAQPRMSAGSGVIVAAASTSKAMRILSRPMPQSTPAIPAAPL